MHGVHQVMYRIRSAGLRPFHYKPQDNAATIMQRAASQEHVDRLFNMLEQNGASKELVDLLKHMLVINPSKRYSMQQVCGISMPTTPFLS